MEEKEAERIIEAALFMSSRPLAASELGKLIGVAAPGYIHQRLDSLRARYESSGSSIEIALEDGKYYMRLKPQYAQHVKDFAQQGEISRHALRTLAYISKNEGIRKSVLASKLGSGIYQDVAELVQKGFVAQKKDGRTKSLHTTPKFRMYFGGAGSGNEQNAGAAQPEGK
ncbi:MAG: SMC-Scp complex subunit ScpB [Candidatus Micrarchaeota archaeon]|nr:SMC-Scp complex subunit ScpB [Candidatus Micrarchaeota archaeon]